MAAARFVRNPNLKNELANEVMGSVLVNAGKAINANVPRNLPAGASGGRRVAPWVRRRYVTAPQGSGEHMYVEAGTRWKIAPLIEWGTRTSPAYGVLRKAVLQTGMTFRGQ